VQENSVLFSPTFKKVEKWRNLLFWANSFKKGQIWPIKSHMAILVCVDKREGRSCNIVLIITMLMGEKSYELRHQSGGNPIKN